LDRQNNRRCAGYRNRGLWVQKCGAAWREEGFICGAASAKRVVDRTDTRIMDFQSPELVNVAVVSSSPRGAGGALIAAPLSAAQIEAIALARQQSRVIRRAAAVAAFSGWCTAIFAGLSLLGGLFSVSSFVLGIGFSVCATIELRGSGSLRRFDATAPARLAWNQIALGSMLVVYSAWCIAQAMGSPVSQDAAAAGAEVAQMMESIGRLQTTVTVAFYGAVIVCSIIAQGSAAWYYASRGPHLRAYLSRTPEWVIDMLRVAG
jgi:hypothetical protein